MSRNYCGIIPENDEAHSGSVCKHCHRPIDSQTCRAMCRDAHQRCRRTIMDRKWCQEHAGPCIATYNDYKKWRRTALEYLASGMKVEQLDQYINSPLPDRKSLDLLRREWHKTWPSFRKFSLFRLALARESSLRKEHTRDCFASEGDPGHAHVITRLDLLVRDLQENPNLYLTSAHTPKPVEPLPVSSIFSPLSQVSLQEQEQEEQEEQEEQVEEKKKKKKKKKTKAKEEAKAFREAESFRKQQLTVPEEEWDKALDIMLAEGPERLSNILKLAAEWTLTDPSLDSDTSHINRSWPAPLISRENTGSTFMCFNESKELLVMPVPSRTPQQISLEIRFKKEKLSYISEWSEERYADIKNADLLLQVWINLQGTQDLLATQENAYLYLFDYCKRQFAPFKVEVVGIPKPPAIPASQLLRPDQIVPLQAVRTYVENCREVLQKEIITLGLAFRDQVEITRDIQNVLAASICFLWLQTATFRLMYIPAKLRLADRKKNKKG